MKCCDYNTRNANDSAKKFYNFEKMTEEHQTQIKEKWNPLIVFHTLIGRERGRGKEGERKEERGGGAFVRNLFGPRSVFYFELIMTDSIKIFDAVHSLV